MDRKELIVVLLLAILVALLATVRLFHGPLAAYPQEQEPSASTAPHRPDGREPATAPSQAAELAKRLPPFPAERYTPRDPDIRAIFEDAERVFLQALIQVATEPKDPRESSAIPSDPLTSSAPILERAVKNYLNFNERYRGEPAGEVALLRVGQCYTVMKRYEAAARAYDHFLKVYPKSELCPMALLWSGDNHLREGDTEVAKERLDEVITQYPTSQFAEGALLRLGQCYTAMKRVHEATLAYDRFLAAYPKSELRPMALLGSADSHLKEGDTKTAQERLEEVIKQDPASPFAKIAQQRLAQLKAPSPK